MTGRLREKIIDSLSDPASRRIIEAVISKSKTAGEIEKDLNLSQSTLYRKISELKACGLLMIDEFVFRQDSRREALYACPFTELRLKLSPKEIELELIETTQSAERKWFTLFFSKQTSASQSELP